MVQRVGERLQDLLRPESSSIYLQSKGAFTPIFVHSQRELPSYENDHPLVAALRRRRGSLTLERGVRRRGGEPDAFERAALEALGVPVVVSLRHRDDLRGFVCLGRKSSGDVYTSTDLAFLAAVADKLGSQLATTTLEQKAVAILFTDLVSSTLMLQRLGDDRAQRVFAAHHERISSAITRCDGRELQWLGDGSMAAFDSAADALRCSAAIHEQSEEPIEGERLHVRVGLNVGEILRQETGSGYFGLAVVTARRLCDLAQPGQTLCTQTVAGLVSGRAGFHFRDLGAVVGAAASD